MENQSTIPAQFGKLYLDKGTFTKVCLWELFLTFLVNTHLAKLGHHLKSSTEFLNLSAVLPKGWTKKRHIPKNQLPKPLVKTSLHLKSVFCNICSFIHKRQKVN